ncbi:MAG: 6-hydroxymethylpterin diphosphokinase MptE-like protein [Thermodesulfobacteriota bacterium]
MKIFWQENLQALRRKDPELHALVCGHEHRPVGELLETPSGLPTLRFFPVADKPGQPSSVAYNEQDPWQDAARHLGTVEPGAHGLALFVGMGLGYGPLVVLRERPTLGMVVIIEPSLDLFVTALQVADLRPLLLSPKVHFLVGDIDFERLGRTVERIASLEDTHLLRHVPSFQWREDVYPPLDRKVLMQVNRFNAFGGTTRAAGERFFENRMANLSLLRHSADFVLLKDLFAGKPAVLVASGPSLDQSLEELKKIAGRCVLIAVDAALAPLLRAGIMPDFVTTIDFHYVNFEKMAPYTAASSPWPFSLITTIKGVPLIPKRLPVKHRFWTFHDDRAQLWLMEALQVDELIPPAASVAHLSLGCALLMGCDPIILVGQDLAYNSGTATHAAGTIIKGSGLPEGVDLFMVEGVDGGQVHSDRALMCFQKVFEDVFAALPDRTFLNATAAGARLAGTRRVTLPEVGAEWLPDSVPVQPVVDEVVGCRTVFPVEGFLAACRSDMAALKNLQKKFTEVRRLADAARQGVAGLRRKRSAIAEFSRLPPELAEKLRNLDRMSNAMDASLRFANQVVELTFPALTTNERQRMANERLQEQEGYLAWLAAEIERIDTVNSEKQKACTMHGELLTKLAHHLEDEGRLLGQASSCPAMETLLALARLYAGAGDYQLAREWIEKVLAMPEASFESYVLAGRIRAELLDFSGARAAWQQAMVLAPEAVTEVSRVRQHLAAGWVEIAHRHGMPGSSREDDHPRLLPLWLGRAAMLLEGEKELPPLLPLLWNKHRENMEQWLVAGRHDLVDLLLAGWEVFAERFPEVLVIRARSAAARGDQAVALECLEKAVQRDSGQAQWLALLARFLLEAGRFDEGLSRLREAVSLDRETAILWEELGDTLVAMQDRAGALTAFEQCYLALPERLDVLCKMGDCYLAAAQPESAMAAYEAFLARRPGEALVVHRLTQARAMAARLAQPV